MSQSPAGSHAFVAWAVLPKRPQTTLSFVAHDTAPAATMLSAGTPTVGGAWEQRTSRDGTTLFVHGASTSTPGSGPHELCDHFAALIPVEGRYELLTDRFATVPLYIAETEHCWLVATQLGLLRELLSAAGKAPDIDPQALFSYFFFHMIPAPRTIWTGIEKMEPGTRLVLDAQHKRGERWWHPEFDAGKPARARDALMAALYEGTNHCAPASGPVGAFLSGGLDSSTVAGLLATREGATETHTFSIGFDAAEQYNELPYARATAEHFGTRQHEYVVRPSDIAGVVPEIARHYGEPFGNSSALPTYYCARFARENGFDLLLAGDGGDELFGGNDRYAKQLALCRFDQWAPLVHGAAALGRLLPGNPLSRKAGSLSDQLKLSLARRLQVYNFVHRLGETSIFTPAFLSAVDSAKPLEALEARIAELPAGVGTVDRMLYLDWKFTLADNDLPKVVQMCQLNGVAVRFPLLTDAVVDFSLTLHEADKTDSRRLRIFYREAMRGFLSETTLRKSKHGFGLPFGLWLRQDKPLAALVANSLASLKDRGLFQPDFLDQTARLVREEHAGYYGELAWILMSLEQWFAAHQPDYVFAGRS